MTMLLRKMFEKLALVIFALLIIVGNTILIYNLCNNYVKIDQKTDIDQFILNAKYIEITDINKNYKKEVISNENVDNLIKAFNKIKVRDSKINFLDKNQKYFYTVYIVKNDGEEEYIDIANRQIMLHDKVYTTDISIKEIFDDIFK